MDCQKPHQQEKKMVDQYLRSIAFKNEAESVADIMLLVDNPFVDAKNSDAISLIFHRFFKHTDTHPGLPIFSYLGMISAWCVLNGATCRIPLTSSKTELDTWVLVLGNTGQTKSLSIKTLMSALPKNLETGEPIVKPNFMQPASNASLVDQVSKLPNYRGFWQQDEASQFIKQIDQIAGPLAGIKQSLLIVKDHGSLDYATKSGGIVSIKGPVLTVLMLNTVDAMKKAFTADSMVDGTFRRFTVAMADKHNIGGARRFEETALYDLNAITDETLETAMGDVFAQDITDKTFIYTPACRLLYEATFAAFWSRQYEKFMSEHQAYYRTYMMESWRYAVFHHLTHKKAGNVVDEFSLQWGLKVSMYMLNSLQAFLSYRARKEPIKPESDRVKRLMDFIVENEQKPHFGMRAVCRRFTMTKEEVHSYLITIRAHDKRFKTKLFDDLAKHEAKQRLPLAA